MQLAWGMMRLAGQMAALLPIYSMNSKQQEARGGVAIPACLTMLAQTVGRGNLLAESDETGTSEIKLEAMVEGQELQIAFNVKFLQDGLETIATKNGVFEANAHNTPAVIHLIGEKEN